MSARRLLRGLIALWVLSAVAIIGTALSVAAMRRAER